MNFLNEADKKLLQESEIPKILRINEEKDYEKTYAPIPESKRLLFERGLKNLQNDITEKLNEGTLSGDLSKFIPKLVPIYRRLFPFLIGPEVAGNHILKTPQAAIFALRYHYTNDSANSIAMDATATQSSSQILVVDDVSSFTAGDSITSSGGGSGTVRYVEDQNSMGPAILVEIDGSTSSNAFSAGETVDDADPYVTAAATISAVYDNEAGYNYFLQNYSGPYSTAAAEALSTDMKEVGLSIDTANVSAQERWLKAVYSMSAAQDLKNVHGLDMDSELLNIMTYEIAQSKNRQIIDSINDNASNTNYNVNTGSDGRWEAEKFRALYTQLVRRSNQIATATRRGPGNFILASDDAVTALESLQSFQYQPVTGNIDTSQYSSAYAGNIGSRFKVYRDTISSAISSNSDYATVGYRGASNWDAGVFHSVYVPLQVYRAFGENDAQPRIFAQSRDAVTTSIFGTVNYYRKMTLSSIF